MDPTEQQFLNDLDNRLWTAANRLLPMLDAAVYKHVVLGLIFLKYVSDALKGRRAELETNFRDVKHDYYLGEDVDELIVEELETRLQEMRHNRPQAHSGDVLVQQSDRGL